MENLLKNDFVFFKSLNNDEFLAVGKKDRFEKNKYTVYKLKTNNGISETEIAVETFIKSFSKKSEAIKFCLK